jgi:hypothetical protein
MKESRQSNWRVPCHHAGRDGATSYQSRQLDQRDWCLSRASLFDVTQFPEYLAPLFLFLPPHFLSFYILSPPHGGYIGNSYFSPQILLLIPYRSEFETITTIGPDKTGPPDLPNWTVWFPQLRVGAPSSC